VSNKVGLGETCYFRSSNAFATWQHKLELISLLRVRVQNYLPGGGTVARSQWRQLRFLVLSLCPVHVICMLNVVTL